MVAGGVVGGGMGETGEGGQEYTYLHEHQEIERNAESSYRTPETNLTLCINYT